MVKPQARGHGELSMDGDKSLKAALQAHPKWAAALHRAVEHEEGNAHHSDYAGWQWSDVALGPGDLTRMVVEGFLRVTKKVRGANSYLLANRAVVKKALAAHRGL